MLFKVNEANIRHVCDVLSEYPECWLHGDGNVFADKTASDYSLKYSNPAPNSMPSAAMYRVHFDDINNVPTADKKGILMIERMLMDDAQRRAKQEAEVRTRKPSVKVLSQKFARPAADPHAEKAEALAEKEGALSDKEAYLEEKHAAVTDAAEQVKAQAEALAKKEQELAQREEKLKQAADRLEALRKPAETAAPNNTGKPAGK